jgi:2-hydroxychromene-2-carboxylate isomerase
MTLSVDMFFSFRSPYSYLALPKVLKLVADYDVTVNLRPIYPLAVRVPGFFKRTNPQFLSYVALDSRRVAERANIAFRHHRVTGGGRPPPVPTERSVRIYRTTLFGSWFTALLTPAASRMGDAVLVSATVSVL